jgi:hypothetical protein
MALTTLYTRKTGPLRESKLNIPFAVAAGFINTSLGC